MADEPITSTADISEAQRGGSITGIGIILGFSLTFIGQWSLGHGNWRLIQAFALAVSGIGIILQLLSLFQVLRLPLQSIDGHRQAMRRFISGVAFVLIGFALHVVFDLMVDVLHWNLP